MTEAIEALQAYRLKLKEQNKTLHASVVARRRIRAHQPMLEIV